MIPTVETKPFAIFDMDGTLVDSMWGWNEIYITFLVAHGATNEAAKEIVAHTAHFTTYESAELFREYLSLDTPAADIAAGLDAACAAGWEEPPSSPPPSSEPNSPPP